MISIKLVGKGEDRKIVSIVDDYTPAPHRLARITEKSTNYGLADEARKLFPELMKKNKGDWPGAVFDRKKVGKLRAVGEAYKEKETDEDIITNIGDYEESVASDDEDTELTETTEVSNAKAAVLATSASSRRKLVRKIVSRVVPKCNGYRLFINHIAREKKVTGGFTELMEKFDKEWKMLPDHEKAEWKSRAKSGDWGRPGSSRGKGGELMESRGVVEPEDGTGPMKRQEGRGLMEREKTSNAPVAAPLAPRGRGHGCGRGLGSATPVNVGVYEDHEEGFH